MTAVFSTAIVSFGALVMSLTIAATAKRWRTRRNAVVVALVLAVVFGWAAGLFVMAPSYD